MTDVNLVASLQQVELLAALSHQLGTLATTTAKEEVEAAARVTDSGVECGEAASSAGGRSAAAAVSLVPVEVLATCSSLRLGLHRYEATTAGVTPEDVRMWRRYLHPHRRQAGERRVSEGSGGSDEARRVVDVLEEAVPRLEEEAAEAGYEASEEESSVGAVGASVRLVPVVAATLTHPHVFCSLSPAQQKVDVSVYDLHLATAPAGFHLPAASGKKIPWTRDFPTTLLDTRPGRAHAKSGVRPALVTVTLAELATEAPRLVVKVERPVRVVLGRGRVDRLRRELEGMVGKEGEVQEREVGGGVGSLPVRRVSVTTGQLVAVWEEKELESCSVTASLGSLTSSLDLDQGTSSRLTISLTAALQRAAISLHRGALGHALLSPLNLTVSGGKVVRPDLGPMEQATLQVELEQLQLHLGPHHLHILSLLASTLNFGSSSTKEEKVEGNMLPAPCEGGEEEEEVHYQDDLRAGAFQVVDPVLEGEAGEPAPYQVVSDASSLTWRYPQPRALTRVVIFPLPFVEASEFSFAEGGGERVDCELLHWSESLSSYVVYSTFQLSESQVVHLDLPLARDRRSCAAAATWRVRLSHQADQAYISPLALVSVLKVDSFSSPRLLPSSSLSLRASSILLHLHNHLHYAGQQLAPGLPLEDLALDTSFPADQQLATLTVSRLALGSSLWPAEEGQAVVQTSVKARLAVHYVDQTFLALHPLLAPVEVQAGLQLWQGQTDATVSVGAAHLSGGPLLLHAARQSARLWQQVDGRLKSGTTDLPAPYIPIAQILVVNETGQVIRFGQAGTEESILLEPRHCAPYAWRSQRASQRLHVAVEGRAWAWGEPFPLAPGQRCVGLGEEGGLRAVLQVDAVSPGLKLVRVCGLLSVLSLLREHMELRVVPPASKETRCLVGSYARATSVVAECAGVVLKTRYLGLGTPWSGDIALESVVGRRRSFMVKLPLQEKGTCTTVWCSVLTESLAGATRQLVTFSPLYVLSSLLPSPLTTHVTVPGQDAAQQQELPGLGTSAQLDVQAPPETKFSLSFSVSPELPASAPPLAVSWGIIDQVRGKSRPVPSIDFVLASSAGYNLRAAPRGLATQLAGLAVAGQPRTDCRVSFTEFHPATNTLTVRVAPPLLLVNRCSVPLLSRQAGQPSWLLPPRSVLHPPPLPDGRLLLGLHRGGEEAWGPEVELSEQDWTYVAIRPSQQSVLHLHSSLQYAVTSPAATAFLTVESSVVDGVRLLTIRPTFLLVNRTEEDLVVRTEVQPDLTVENRVEKEAAEVKVEVEELVVGGGATTPVVWWPRVARGAGHLTHHLLLASPGAAPAPRLALPLDRDLRHCIALPGRGGGATRPVVVASHRERSQVLLLVLADLQPQVLLHNLLPAAVAWREEGRAGSTGGRAAAGERVHATLPWLQEGFPYCEQEAASRRLQVGLGGEPGTQAANWSTGVDLTATQETFVRLPGHGDIRVRVEALQPTAHVFLEPVSHLEVAARDIRARFAASPAPPVLSPDASFATVPSRDCSFKTALEDSVEEDAVSACSSFTHVASTTTSTSTGPVVSIKMEQLSIALTDDLVQFDDLQEVVRVTVSGLDLRCQPSTDFSTLYRALEGGHLTTTELLLTAQEVQVDNQLFPRGVFHFPVLLSRQAEGGAPMLRASASLVNGATRQFTLSLQPLAVCLEDTMVYEVQRFLGSCTLPSSPVAEVQEEEAVPPAVLWAVESSTRLVFHQKVVVEQVDLQVSAHASLKLFVGVEDSKLSLGRFEATGVWSTWYSLGHRLSRHYLSGALFKAGWVVGSLDMLGSPAAFTRNVTDGVKDFVLLPYEGLWHGPWGLLVGLTAGSSSLVKHVSAGTITSITNFASSMSRNLDRLSLDTEHQVRNEESRRQRPQGVGEGLLSGLTTLGVSVLGAVGGLAHHPIQVLLSEGLAPVSLVGGLGRGMVGVVTKPLGSAAELVAQTGQGMLAGSGWSRERRAVTSLPPSLVLELASSTVKYQWKVVGAGDAVTTVPASLVAEGAHHTAVTLLLSRSALYVHWEEEDAVRSVYSLGQVEVEESASDPTLLLVRPRVEREEGYSHVTDRVARYQDTLLTLPQLKPLQHMQLCIKPPVTTQKAS